jgi:uncharacterized protein (DUF2147 family)
MRAIFTFLLIVITTSCFAQRNTILGKWKTIDDNTGKAKSVVEIYEKQGKIYGKIIRLFRTPDEDQDPICVECTDYRKDKKVIGMEIITALEKDGEEYGNGEIMDPEDGKSYRCKIWLENGTLKVRGYIAFLYRTQSWIPYD